MKRWRYLCSIFLVANAIANLLIFLWAYGNSNKSEIIEKINSNTKKFLLQRPSTNTLNAKTGVMQYSYAPIPTHQPLHLTTLEINTTLKSEIPKHIKKSLLFKKWHLNQVSRCGGDFEVHNNDVIVMKNAFINKLLAKGSAGGEDVNEVINQSESIEYYNVQKGFFQLSCKPSYFIPSISYQENWLRAIDIVHQNILTTLKNKVRLHKTLTICLVRFEYANVYWTLMDLYNLFLVLRYLQTSPNETDLLILDGHPKTSLDDLWNFTFKKVIRIKQLENLSLFDKIVWNIDRKTSPLLTMNPTLPFAREFRSFILKSFNIPEKHSRICDNLKILFVWRRDYVNHPRNPKGFISRKITNEREIISAAKKQFPFFNITDRQLDSIKVKDQLSLISQTDIFIGMHGAAFGFTGILPPKSALVELFPHAYGHNWHFEFLAKWNDIYYHRWENTFPDNEDHVKMSTSIPPTVVNDLITDAAIRICPILRNRFFIQPSKSSNATKSKKTALQNTTNTIVKLEKIDKDRYRVIRLN